MIRDDFTLETASWSADEIDLKAVRTAVFLLEQAIPESEEWDALDARSVHVLARDRDGRPIGTGRLTPERTIGRMAVIAEWRGHGIGEAIMRHLLERARQLRYPALDLHAQTHAISFYARFGFEPYGDTFVECGIPHRMMRAPLEPSEPYHPVARLEETPEPHLIVLDDGDGTSAATRQVLALAKRSLCIYTRDLDPVLFGTEAALEQLHRIGTAGVHASVRILIQQPDLPLRNGHRLIHLAKRLPSVFHFRTPLDEEDLRYPSAFLLNDRRSYLFRPLGSRFEGEAHTYAPGRHAQLFEYFNQVWERSGLSEELREFRL